MRKICLARHKPQHLGIVSDAHHYRDADGKLYVLTPVARQFERWAELFPRVTVCAPLLSGAPPSTHSAYRNPQIRLLPISLAGGDSARAKLHLLAQIFRWIFTLNRLFNTVDAVHIRCPNNISVIGLLLLQLRRLPRQAVYTGSWRDFPNEPFFYRWQRLFLRAHFAGPVAIYGEDAAGGAHLVSSFSPTYGDDVWHEESENVARRLEKLREYSQWPRPLKLVSVGALSANKNQQLVIQAVRKLEENGVESTLHILGDGTQRVELEALAASLGVTGKVIFHGRTAQDEVRRFYRESDFVVQAPRQEGYGKVPIEAFFHGCIPILSDVDLTRDILGASGESSGERGRYFPLEDCDALVQRLRELADAPPEMARLIENGRAYAREHTLEAWREQLRHMLSRFWNVSL